MGRRGLGAKLVGVSVLALALAFALFYLVSGVAAPAVQNQHGGQAKHNPGNAQQLFLSLGQRSEERRVGKEC